MKRFLMVFACAAVLALPAQACETKSIDIKVNGLVCDFCARAVEKVMGGQDGVTKVDVNLDEGMIHLQTTPQTKLDDAELTKLVTDSGYSVVKIERGGC